MSKYAIRNAAYYFDLDESRARLNDAARQLALPTVTQFMDAIREEFKLTGYTTLELAAAFVSDTTYFYIASEICRLRQADISAVGLAIRPEALPDGDPGSKDSCRLERAWRLIADEDWYKALPMMARSMDEDGHDLTHHVDPLGIKVSGVQLLRFPQTGWTDLTTLAATLGEEVVTRMVARQKHSLDGCVVCFLNPAELLNVPKQLG